MSKFIFFIPLLILVLIGAGCQTNTVQDSLDDENGDTEITPGITSETFESEQGDFSYTLTWNTDLLSLSEEAYTEASEYAPSFDIVGGGNITVATGSIDSPGYQMSTFINDRYYDGDREKVWSSEVAPSEAGMNNPVYFFSQPTDWDPACIVRYGVVKGLNEALSVRLEDCDDNDMKSSEAFSDLLSDLVITRK